MRWKTHDIRIIRDKTAWIDKGPIGTGVSALSSECVAYYVGACERATTDKKHQDGGCPSQDSHTFWIPTTEIKKVYSKRFDVGDLFRVLIASKWYWCLFAQISKI
jgi:hypothetical protein